TVQVSNTDSVAHQAAGYGELAIRKDRRYRVSDRQCGELLALGNEESIGADHEPACPQLEQGCEDRIEVALGARVQDMKLQPEGARRRLQISRQGLGTGIGWIDEDRNDGCSRDQLVQHFQPLRSYFYGQRGDAREVTARSIEAGDEALLDRIEAGREDDRNRRCCRLGHRGRRNGAYGNHRHLTANQVGRECGQSIIVTLCPAIFDRNVLAFDVAGLLQTLAEGGHVTRVSLWRCAVEEPDHRHRRLLRARRKRPSGYTSADKYDEVPPPHGAYPKARITN